MQKDQPKMKIDGGCHCGYLTYEAEINPDHLGVYHCEDCQSFSGSAFREFTPALDDVDMRQLLGEVHGAG